MTPRGRPHPVTHTIRRHLPWVVIAIAAIAIPALAQGAPERAPGSITVYDFRFENAATGDGTVTINVGETVTFAYPNGNNFHNVEFQTAQPTSCTLLGAARVPRRCRRTRAPTHGRERACSTPRGRTTSSARRTAS